MGIIRKQALGNSIFSYLGVVLGYVNVILLFPAFFSSEQFGLIQLLVGVSVIYAYSGLIGLPNTVVRFFPFYKTEDKYHKGFLSYVLVIGLMGLILATLLYLLLRHPITNAYIENSALFVDYYYYLIPLSVFTLLFTVLEAIARALYRTVFSTFLKEVGLRMLTTLGIVFYIFKVLDFHSFVVYFILINVLNAILLLFQIIFSGDLKFNFGFKDFKFEKLKEFLTYGSFNLLSGTTMLIGQRVDVLMIGSMVGLSIVGAYSLYFYVASVIYVPMRAMSKISVSIIANSFKEGNLSHINDIYKRSSLIQLIFGCLIYIGVIINKHNLFYFIKKPEYIENFGIFYFVGLAILIDISVGLNSEIIVNSKWYKYDSFFNVILLLVSIAANYLLIPLFGGVGAAMAATISFFTFNFLKWIFISMKLKMQPLNYKQLIVILIAILSFIPGYYLPVIDNIYIDIIYRSTIVTVIYGLLIVIFKVSGDLNERVIVYKNLVFDKLKFSGK